VTDTFAAIGPELHAKLAGVVARNRLPGAVAGAVHRNELAWSATIGLADVTAGQPAEVGTLFRIASITKPFTGTAIMQLRDAGMLDLDDPAVRWLPELRGAVSGLAPIETVTIRRMLSHESGLPSEPPGTDWSVPAYRGDPGQVLRRPGDITLRLPPNFRHKYSDLAYQLLGEIVARVTGTPFAQYLSESVLAPLGMQATAFEPLSGSLQDRCATGYRELGLSDEPDPARCWGCTPGPASPMLSGWNGGTGGSPSPVLSRVAGGFRCRRPAIRRSSPLTSTPRKLATR